jgi:hypothetical protein
MSYDLAFWKQKPNYTGRPANIYRDLLEGRAVDGLDTISAAEFLSRVGQQFPGIVSDGGLVFWEGGKRGMFEVYSSDQHFHFCCRQMSGDDMNALIELAAEFDYRLYDPQEERRFDG